LLLWIGGVAGGAGGYWLARTLGRRAALRFLPPEPFHRYETFFATRAQWRSILLFRLALQSELPSYVLGVLEKKESIAETAAKRRKTAIPARG
ncbi:MAG: hypothetical protein ACKORK_10340, partial [Gemmatimonadota bacterium]